MKEIEESFVFLRAGGVRPEGSQLLTRPLHPGVGQRCFAALDSDGQRHVLVELGDERLTPDTGSRGVALGKRQLNVDGVTVNFVDLHCRISTLNLVFERFIEDIFRRLKDAAAPKAGAICRAVLADWRTLLQSAQRPMSREFVVGLTGELEILERICDDPQAALDAWRGPEGFCHDFAVDGSEIEVKSTASIDGNFVRISNIDQLDPSDLDELHLAVVHLRETSGGETLDDRVVRLVSMGFPRDQLIEKLRSVGYIYESGMDTGMRFGTRTIRVWKVDEGFPGLRRDELGSRLHGVSGINYELALDSVPKPLNTESQATFLEGFCGTSDG